MDSLLRLALALFALCAPVRKEGRVIAAHHSLLRAGGATSRDYVQDGLYYQLDGIENAGRGVHSATATTWTDLTGNGRDATFLSAASGLVWQDDAAYLYGKTHDGMAKISGLPSMTAFTFEIVHRMDANEGYGRCFESEAYGSGAKRFSCMNGTGSDTSKCGFNLASDTDIPIFPVSSIARSFAVVPAKSGNIYGPKVYLNGAYANTTFPGSATTPQLASYLDVANRSNNPNRGCDMAVFAIRCYNRILTDAEIAANFAIDQERFNLT